MIVAALASSTAGAALGEYAARSEQARWLGAAVLLGMVFLASLLERLQYQLRASEQSVWWASNGRDVVNAFAFGAMTLGLVVDGFGGPIAVCLAATFVVLLSALQASVERHRLATVWSLGWGLGLGTPVLVWPRAVHELCRTVLTALFG